MILVKKILFIFIIYFITSTSYSVSTLDVFNLHNLESSVVSLQNKSDKNTAFYIGDGRFVTSFQVISIMFQNINDFIISISHKNKIKKMFIKKILHLDALNDLAVVQVDIQDIQKLNKIMSPLKMSIDTSLNKNYTHKVIALDYSNNQLAVKIIPISSQNIIFKHDIFKFISKDIKPGMSGAPFLINNKVISILSSASSDLINTTPVVKLLSLIHTTPLNCTNISCIKQELNNLEIKAKNNNLKAQYTLGHIYYSTGIFHNINKAHYWLLKVARKGYANAQYTLGVMHLTGKGAKQNKLIAYDWFLQAAKQHHIESQHNIGLMYLKGDGITQNITLAKYWLRLSYKSKTLMFSHTANTTSKCTDAF